MPRSMSVPAAPIRQRPHFRRALLVLGLLLVAVFPAIALADNPISFCVPTTPGAPMTTPTAAGKCTGTAALQTTASQTDLATTETALTNATTRISSLETILQGVTRTIVNGNPTVTFSGVNVQVVNGAGSTTSTNGLGNLIVGYNESAGSQTGSHNIILGHDQTTTSYGAITTGGWNNVLSPYGVAFGSGNTVAGYGSAITGGANSAVGGAYSSITGGCDNTAGILDRGPGWLALCTAAGSVGQTVNGGEGNQAMGPFASITGGYGGIG